MKVLVINSYAGSLVLGATARGDEIIGSYEDKGYGLPIQRENFPHLNYVERLEHWPAQDLSETVVIAHPPCAAFSVQNRGGAHARGADAAAFRCTVNLLGYAMRNGAAAIAVESVVGALNGGRAVHDRFALDYRYDLYRILINAGSFGVPQYRNRFWAVFLRKGITNGSLPLALTPRRTSVGAMMERSEGGVNTPVEYVENQTTMQLALLRLVLEPEELQRYLTTVTGSVVKTLPIFIGAEGAEIERVQRRHTMGWNYTSHSMVALAPDDLAPVLMAGSWWWYRTRALSQEDYKDVMGFPRDYRFPGRYYTQRLREYLSRGVCPPTATWILDMVEHALRHTAPIGSHQAEAKPGETADLRFARKEKERCP